MSDIAPCRDCGRDTFHDVVHTVNVHDPDHEYYHAEDYEILRCKGCGLHGFRYTFHDLETGTPAGHLIDYKHFPPPEPRLVDNWRALPTEVRDIYFEAHQAYQVGALRLAVVGMRSVIEMTAKDEGKSDGNLKEKVDWLSDQGLISNRDAERLHAIRIKGNAAIHEVVKPTPEQAAIVVKIVHHLLETAYLLDKEVRFTSLIAEPDF